MCREIGNETDGDGFDRVVKQGGRKGYMKMGKIADSVLGQEIVFAIGSTEGCWKVN